MVAQEKVRYGPQLSHIVRNSLVILICWVCQMNIINDIVTLCVLDVATILGNIYM